MRRRYFGLTGILVCVAILHACFSSPVAGFTIVEPNPGATFAPGDTINMRVLFGANEQPAKVFLYATNMKYSELRSKSPYNLTFTIPKSFTGKDVLVATAKFSDGSIVERQVEINVVLPANIALQGISVDPTFILLQKMPLGTDANKILAFEIENVGVGGMYSDGVERGLTSPDKGTTYTSSNEKVATVSPEGKVTAQGLGKAIITVRNGKFSSTVDVLVKPYKK